MKLFLDTANVDEIRKANEMGVICGVTTNPSLIAKEGRDYVETLKEIATIVDGPIPGEVKATTEDAPTMIEEGRAIYALDPEHMVVKIPMTAEGLKAIKVLSAEGIPTNCTLIFSTNQALLAARADGHEVTTLEGLQGEALEFGAFIADQGAEQCGFCNPGFVLNTLALLRENPDPSEAEIRAYLAGNLCRCSGYEGQTRGILNYLRWKKDKEAKA